MTSGSVWNYYMDKIDDTEVNDSKIFKYKTKTVKETPEPRNPRTKQHDHHNHF